VEVETLETKALGLVDELDDPKPGHMSDHPTALTATTTTKVEGTGNVSKLLFGSLGQRFVKASGQEERSRHMAAGDVDKEKKVV
jgi:serine/threonine-protein phosphatase 4 regulatory subunit 2